MMTSSGAFSVGDFGEGRAILGRLVLEIAESAILGCLEPRYYASIGSSCGGLARTNIAGAVRSMVAKDATPSM